MSEGRMDKIYSLEIPPPPESWEKLAARLEDEHRPDEIGAAARLYPMEVAPPPLLWNKIAEALENPGNPATKRPLIRMRAFRLAAAAVTAGLLILSIVFWLRNRPAEPALAGTAAGSRDLPAAGPNQSSDSLPEQETVRQEENIPEVRRQQPSPEIKPAKQAPHESYAVESFDGTEDDHIAAASVALLQPAENAMHSEVEAPPLRDAKGQIILDRKLLTSADGNYLTVTSPNGQQTRLSAKFLPVIGYMNADPKPEEYLDLIIRESAFWKMKFQEWRNQLVSRYRYAPDAGNFLDILELKSLLEKEMR